MTDKDTMPKEHHIYKEHPKKIYAGRMGIHTNGMVTPHYVYHRLDPDDIVISRKELEEIRDAFLILSKHASKNILDDMKLIMETEAGKIDKILGMGND